MDSIVNGCISLGILLVIYIIISICLANNYRRKLTNLHKKIEEYEIVITFAEVGEKYIK